MSHGCPTRVSGPAHLLRLLVAVFAIALQIGAATASPALDRAEAQAAQLAAASIFCTGVHHQADGNKPPPHRHVIGQALFSALSAAGHAAVLSDHGPALPEPASLWIGAVTTPPARAPPGTHLASPFPRGPPHAV
jgi:hypothetical protein